MGYANIERAGEMKNASRAAPDPLFDLEKAIDDLDTTFGAYVAPEIERLRDVDPNDPEAGRILEWTAKLARAITLVTARGMQVFGSEPGAWLDGELRKRLLAVEVRGFRQGERRGVIAGYERGAMDALMSENAPIAPGTPKIEWALEKMKTRRQGRPLEAWERALW